MRRVEEAQAAVLDERDVAPGELELEQVRVVAGAEEHGLLLQFHPLLARREHALADRVSLRDFVARLDELDGCCRRRDRSQSAFGVRRADPARRRAFATARIGPLER